VPAESDTVQYLATIVHRYENELEVAVAAVREAAALCRNVQAGISPDVISKKDRSPVTVADFGSQALVCRAVRAAFPDDPIIAEEDAALLRQPGNESILEQVEAQVRQVRPDMKPGETCTWIDFGREGDYSDRFWTLDPIDGTKGFLRGEQYAIALALIVDGEICVAALGCPNLSAGFPEQVGSGGIYAAVREGGSFLIPLGHGSERRRLIVSDKQNPEKARFCEPVESAHSSHEDAAAVAMRLGIGTSPVRLDSQAKYAVLSGGDAEIYMRLPTRTAYIEYIWDHAAGVLVIEEAGGRVTDISGQPLNFRFGRRLEENTGILATNGYLHNQVLDALDATLRLS
jgi:3'(2'), 5'-bisphosphate nucleotidase